MNEEDAHRSVPLKVLRERREEVGYEEGSWGRYNTSSISLAIDTVVGPRVDASAQFQN